MSKCWPWNHAIAWGPKEVEKFSRMPTFERDAPGFVLDGKRIEFTETAQYGRCSKCGLEKRRQLK